MKNKIDILKSKYSNHIILILLSTITISYLYISPDEASNLSFSPDSVEYAIAGHNLIYKGFCKISYMDNLFPIRYTPWFSIFFIAPSFLIFGSCIGNAIFPVMTFGILGIIAAYLIGKDISTPIGGILSGLIILSLPVYKKFSQLVMTDIPTNTIILFSALIYLKIDSRKKYSIYMIALSGLLCGLSTALRPATFSVILPFILMILTSRLSIFKKLIRTIIVILPGLAVIIMTCIYNYLNFGDITRNGYNYWCPIPYDYFNLVFSFNYVKSNLLILFKSPFIIFSIIFFYIYVYQVKRKEKNISGEKKLMIFSLLACIPLIIFHLFYFYSEQRFFLPAMSLFIILASSAFVNSHKNSKLNLIIIFILFLAVFSYEIIFSKRDLPARKLIADHINKTTPSDSIIISSIDPVYLNFMTRERANSKRVIIPTSRNVEYASKLIMPKKSIPLAPPPEDHLDHRNKRLLNSGAKEAIPITANSEITAIIDLAKDNNKIFLETSHLSKKEYENFKELYTPYFNFEKKSIFIYKLKFRD